MKQLNADTSFIPEYEESYTIVMKLHINLPTAWFCGLLFLVLEGTANKIDKLSRKLTDIIKN